MRLVIANKLYSSWSLRPWMVLKVFDIPFQETVIPLRQPDTEARIRAHSPTGKVPVLIDGEAVVWESTAIMAYLADRFPNKPIWPRERRGPGPAAPGRRPGEGSARPPRSAPRRSRA